MFVTSNQTRQKTDIQIHQIHILILTMAILRDVENNPLRLF